MHWIALLLFAATALCAGVWVLIRAALANLSNLSVRYPCLPRRVTNPYPSNCVRARSATAGVTTRQDYRAVARLG